MRISTASLGLAAVSVAPVITTAASTAAGRDLSPEQSQVLFQARKTWAKDNYKLRLELLQSQQRCIDAAASADALKTCRRQMKKPGSPSRRTTGRTSAKCGINWGSRRAPATSAMPRGRKSQV